MSVVVGTGTGLLAGLQDDLAGVGLTLRQAVPRAPDHLLLLLERPDGTTVPGQWIADEDQAARVARATGGADLVQRPLPTVVTQAGGADRRLPGLRALLGRPDHELLAHRPERRAVVRHGAPDHPSYTKVVRPGRVAPLVASLELARAGGARAPRVVAHDGEAGTVTTAGLTGVALHDAWDAQVADDPRRTGLRLAACVRQLHGLRGSALPTHDADAELATTRRWLGLARAFGVLPLPDVLVDALLAQASGCLADALPPAPVTLHRDLHDKQLVLDDDGVGVLDLDTLAQGDPALDLANLLVHLDLRVHQGRSRAPTAATVAQALLEGYGAVSRRALEGYSLTTRLRLCAVYAFRPGGAEAGAALLLEPGWAV